MEEDRGGIAQALHSFLAHALDLRRTDRKALTLAICLRVIFREAQGSLPKVLLRVRSLAMLLLAVIGLLHRLLAEMLWRV